MEISAPQPRLTQSGGGFHLEEVEDAAGGVVGMEKLAPGRAGAPNGDLGRSRFCGFVEAANERGQHMGVLRVVVISGAVEVGRHGGVIADAVLAAVELAEFQPGDLGDGVGFVGGLKLTAKERVLADRLLRKFWVDASAAQEEQSLDPGTVGLVDGVLSDGQILEHELGWIRVVGVDAADSGGRDDNDIRLFRCVEIADGLLVGEIEFAADAGGDILETFRSERANHGRADHATMPGDVDMGVLTH